MAIRDPRSEFLEVFPVAGDGVGDGGCRYKAGCEARKPSRSRESIEERALINQEGTNGSRREKTC